MKASTDSAKSSGAFRRVGIFANTRKPAAQKVLKQLPEWLQKQNCEPLELKNGKLDARLGRLDFIICLGGDGTMLSMAGQMRGEGAPVLGVNLGGLGFLTEVRVNELHGELKKILAGNFAVEERRLLKASVFRSSRSGAMKKIREFQALNDIVINREGLTRYMAVCVEVDGEAAIRFFGDGIIVATPTGSTAYSLSAGGPIIYPTLDNMVVTPICPHASELRPLVLSGAQTVRIRIECDEARERALLTADGQCDVQIDHSAVVEVTCAENRIKLVKSTRRTYFETLREKFKLPL